MTHTMAYVLTNACGEELWRCTACRHRLLIVWTPWRKRMLVVGDDVHHVASKAPRYAVLGVHHA